MKTIVYKLIIIISFSASLNISAQVSQRWISRYDSLSNRDESSTMVVDNSGNIYVTGVTYTGFVSSDYLTIKYNSSGVWQWTATYNGPAVTDSSSDFATSIAVDNTGNVYVTGTSFGAGGARQDYATIKYNSSGVQQWVQRYNGPGNFQDYAYAISVDDSGNVYVTGGGTNAGFNLDYTTIKYNTSGVQQWIKYYDGTASASDYATSIEVDASHNVYVTGSSSGLGSNNDYATIKYNSAGVQQWISPPRYNGPGNSGDHAKSISVDNSGNVYVTGESWGGATNNDYATIKYNSSGIQQWALRYNGTGNSTDIAYSVGVDNAGNIYVTGQSLGIGTSYDYATIKYNSGGVHQWTERYDFGPGGNRDDRAFALALDNSGNVYVTGFSSSSAFNDYATIKYNSSGAQQWIMRYDGSGNYDDAASAIAIDNSGNIIVTGKSYNSSGNYDFATIKYAQAKILNLTVLIQGFYDNFVNSMVPDTAKVILRNVVSPYSIADSSVMILNSNGNGSFNYYNSENSTPYFIVVKHRNSIETWSAGGNSFTSGQLSYDFTINAFQAFGSNMILKGNKYCIYSSDVNQDGGVDLTDLLLIYNDASAFLTGYIPTDVNGDSYADITDLLITFNNSAAFVEVIRP